MLGPLHRFASVWHAVFGSLGCRSGFKKNTHLIMISDVFFIDWFYDCALVYAKLDQSFSFQFSRSFSSIFVPFGRENQWSLIGLVG